MVSSDQTFHFGEFINAALGIVGRTVSTRSEPNTSSEFNFWVTDRQEVLGRIEIGNIMAAVSDTGDDVTFGAVNEMRSYSDVESFIADYLSHDFGSAELELPSDASQVTVVTCAVMRNLSFTTKPVSRSRVYYPSRRGIEFAYGIVDPDGNYLYSGAAIPVGVFENGDGTLAPISVDENFLLGPESAHLNVSGISGLASKTSAIQFVLRSLLDRTKKRVAVVMFNVKSRDLLYVDTANPRLTQDSWSQFVYQELDVTTNPFDGARFFAPSDPANPGSTQSSRAANMEPFGWDLKAIYRDIPSLFSSFDWDDKMEGVWFTIQERIEGDEILTYGQMLNWLNQQINQANSSRPPSQWIFGSHIATWNKMRSHLQRFPRSYRGLIATAGPGSDIPWGELTAGQTFVIDLEVLNDRGQRLVFSRAIRSIDERLESTGDVDAVVVFVDELNKFAPSGNERSPLKAFLIDITARGRSVGMVLFGAEQFASAVDNEIVENSSTFLFGRTEANELRKPNYSGFSDEIKTKLTMLPQGHLLVKFAKFPQPIFVKFPHPPCLPGDRYQDTQSDNTQESPP